MALGNGPARLDETERHGKKTTKHFVTSRNNAIGSNNNQRYFAKWIKKKKLDKRSSRRCCCCCCRCYLLGSNNRRRARTRRYITADGTYGNRESTDDDGSARRRRQRREKKVLNASPPSPTPTQARARDVIGAGGQAATRTGRQAVSLGLFIFVNCRLMEPVVSAADFKRPELRRTRENRRTDPSPPTRREHAGRISRAFRVRSFITTNYYKCARVQQQY